MVFCCFDTPFSDPQSEYYSRVATDEKLLDKDWVDEKGATGSSYPGLRRVPHGPPADFPVPPERMGNNPNIKSGLISVTVPPGVLPGQEIHVRRPDGTGLVEAVVPAGMQEGSVFYVQAPPATHPPRFHSQPPLYQPPAGGSSSGAPAPTASTGAAAPLEGDFANCCSEGDADDRSSTNAGANLPNQNTSPVPRARPGQALVRVPVPPDMKPGTAILVDIPGEPGRRVRAQIPPNVKEFVVAYEAKKPVDSAVPTTTQEDSILPIIGGLATGVAAVMAYEHYS